MLMNKKQQQIFDDYLAGRGDKSSKRKFFQLFREEAGIPDLKKRMAQDWDTTSFVNPHKDLSPILQKIHFLIRSDSENASGGKKMTRTLKLLGRIAAVLVLPLLVINALLFFFAEKPESEPTLVEIISPMGARVRTELPDGTITWLNSGSELSYYIPFKKRNVNVKGNAFFDVKSDSLHPFTVRGNNAEVKVLGTRFNVEMWPGEDIVEVVLEEGVVEFKPDRCEQSFQMTPGEQLVFDNEKRKLTRKQVEPEIYSSWIDGKLLLRGENMVRTARELSRWFNVDVVVEDSTIYDYTFRGTFKDEKLEDVLRLLKLTSPIDYVIEDNKQDSAGNFSRKKVIIQHQ